MSGRVELNCHRAAYGGAERAEPPLSINCQRKREVSRTCLEGTVILSVYKLYLVCVACGGYVCLRVWERETETINLWSWQGNGYTLQSHIEMTLSKSYSRVGCRAKALIAFFSVERIRQNLIYA